MSKHQSMRFLQFCLIVSVLICIFVMPQIAVLLAYITGLHRERLSQFERSMEVSR